jgi:hypothetical protein
MIVALFKAKIASALVLFATLLEYTEITFQIKIAQCKTATTTLQHDISKKSEKKKIITSQTRKYLQLSY